MSTLHCHYSGFIVKVRPDFLYHCHWCIPWPEPHSNISVVSTQVKWVPRAKEDLLDSNPICECKLPISVMRLGPFFAALAKPEPTTNTPWLRYISQGLFCTVPFSFSAVRNRELITTVLELEHCWSKRTRSAELWIRSSPGLINDAGRSWSCFWSTTRETRSYILKSLPVLLLLMIIPLQAKKKNYYRHADRQIWESFTDWTFFGGTWCWKLGSERQPDSDAEDLEIGCLSWSNCSTPSFKLTQGCEFEWATIVKKLSSVWKGVQINWVFSH